MLIESEPNDAMATQSVSLPLTGEMTALKPLPQQLANWPKYLSVEIHSKLAAHFKVSKEVH